MVLVDTVHTISLTNGSVLHSSPNPIFVSTLPRCISSLVVIQVLGHVRPEDPVFPVCTPLSKKPRVPDSRTSAGPAKEPCGDWRCAKHMFHGPRAPLAEQSRYAIRYSALSDGVVHYRARQWLLPFLSVWGWSEFHIETQLVTVE